MEDEKKLLQKAKNVFENLKTDPNSVLFSEENIESRLLKKLKKNKICKGFFAVKAYRARRAKNRR